MPARRVVLNTGIQLALHQWRICEQYVHQLLSTNTPIPPGRGPTTAVYDALWFRDLESREWLLKMVDELTKRQAYFDAFTSKDLVQLRRLLENDTPLGNYSPAADLFVRVVREGDDSLVLWFLEAGISPNLHDTSGITPLMAAAAEGRTSLIRLLIERGAQLEAVDQAGWSALFFAAHSNRLDAVDFLLTAGADAHRRDVECHSVEDVARLQRFSVPFTGGGGVYRSSEATPVVQRLRAHLLKSRS
jgi:hypothetical protein